MLTKQGPRKRKTRRKPACLMDDEHTVIPAHVYQSWLQNASDLVSRARRRKGKVTTNSNVHL